MVGILDVGHRHGGVRHPVVDDRVDGHRHRVFGEDLENKLVECSISVSKRPVSQCQLMLIKKQPWLHACRQAHWMINQLSCIESSSF